MKHGAMQKALVLAKIKANEKIKRPSWDNTRKGPWRGAARKAEGGPIDQPYNGPNLGPLAKGSAAPIDDWAVPPSTTNSAADDWVTPPSDKGIANAVAQGAAQGATFNFSDELRGLGEAGGLKPNEPSGLAPVLKGAYNYFSGDKDAEAAYNAAVARARAEDKTVEQQHPYAHGIGEIAGSLPAMAALPVASLGEGAGLGAKIIQGSKLGAEYGAASGAGEGTDAGSRAIGAGAGTLGGAIGGGAAPIIGGVAGAAYDRFGKPLVSAARGLMNPEAEAGRRLATALSADAEQIAAGKAEGMTPQQWVAAKAAGEPVTLADLGSGNTQSLLRSAANTSPEGRAALEKALNDRFAGQSDRVAEDVKGLVAGGANAGKTADQLVAEYDRGRIPAYQKAFEEGDKEIISPKIHQLLSSPLMVDAMKKASISGKDRAVTEGYGAFHPNVSVEDGVVKFKPKANGLSTYPNLQFWDATKRELDDVATSAARSGEKSKAEVAGNLAKQLRGELDKAVPSYGNARGIASQFFGENNALEAGRKLAGKNVDPDILSQTMRKMKPDERDLFREGYASDWANRVIGNMRDSRDITKAMFNSPNERKRALAVFGPAGIQKIENRMTLETIMDGARKAMGNSTTARQLIEAGLAGGALGGYFDGFHLRGIGEGAAAGVGARKLLSTEIASGARKLIGHVDSKTARNVAELLTSNDPAKLAQGLRLASANKKVGDGLRSIANRLALAAQTKIPHDASGFRSLQGAMPARADQEQQQP